jgi:two-component system, chemotaxis family, chemotaxis protein CheY
MRSRPIFVRPRRKRRGGNDLHPGSYDSFARRVQLGSSPDPTAIDAWGSETTVGSVDVETRRLAEDPGVFPRTALLVDDDPDMRLYLRSCLRSLASPFDRIIEAADGLEALRLIRADAVDLVICDIGLPGLDGYRLVRVIRGDTALRHIAVLLISGDGVVAENTADGFLAKPFNSQQLRAALDALRLRAIPTPPLES